MPKAAFLLLWVLAVPEMGFARDPVSINLNAAARESCHIITFPQGWRLQYVASKSPFPNFRYAEGDYEFRALGSRFLVRALVRDLGKPIYAGNLYEVDLSDPRDLARSASEENWNSATAIPSPRGGDSPWLAVGRLALAKSASFESRQFAKSGNKWAIQGYEMRVSPDRTLLILQSWSGKLVGNGVGANGELPGIPLGFGRNHGKLFFDVFNATTGTKLITVTASFVDIQPEEAFAKTAWVTARYFVVPLADTRERCLVCEFGRNR